MIARTRLGALLRDAARYIRAHEQGRPHTIEAQATTAKLDAMASTLDEMGALLCDVATTFDRMVAAGAVNGEWNNIAERESQRLRAVALGRMPTLRAKR